MHLAFSMCPASHVLPGSAHLMTNKLHCYGMNPLVYSSSSQHIRGRKSRRVFVFPCIPARCYCTSSSCRTTCLIPALFMGPVSLHSVNPHRGSVTQTLIWVCRLSRTFCFQKPLLNHYRSMISEIQDVFNDDSAAALSGHPSSATCPVSQRPGLGLTR